MAGQCTEIQELSERTLALQEHCTLFKRGNSSFTLSCITSKYRLLSGRPSYMSNRDIMVDKHFPYSLACCFWSNCYLCTVTVQEIREPWLKQLTPKSACAYCEIGLMLRKKGGREDCPMCHLWFSKERPGPNPSSRGGRQPLPNNLCKVSIFRENPGHSQPRVRQVRRKGTLIFLSQLVSVRLKITV